MLRACCIACDKSNKAAISKTETSRSACYVALGVPVVIRRCMFVDNDDADSRVASPTSSTLFLTYVVPSRFVDAPYSRRICKWFLIYRFIRIRAA